MVSAVPDNDFILNTGLSLCIRRLSCVSIYKSANDKIVQTGIKAELEAFFSADAPNVISEQDQTATPGTPCTSLCDKCVGSLTSPADHNREDAREGTYR